MSATQYKAQPIFSNKDIVQSNTSLNILMNHLNSFQKNAPEALMSDYTNKSILVTPEATYIGLDQIAAFFTGFITHFPSQNSSFELDKITITKPELATEKIRLIFSSNKWIMLCRTISKSYRNNNIKINDSIRL